MFAKIRKATHTTKNPNVIPTNVLMHMAWRNLMHKKLRAFLTIFGVVIGIGAIFFLLSFGLGLQKLVTDQVIGNQSVKSIDVTTPNSKILKLDGANYERMKNLPHVVQLGASYSYAGSLKASGSEVDTIVYGEDQSYQRLENLTLAKGRLLTANDSRSVMINNASVRSIGLKDAGAAIGKKVSLRVPLTGANRAELNDNFTIVGVIDSDGGNEVFIPGSNFTNAGVRAYNQIKIEVDTSANVPNMRKQIESLGFMTTSPIDTIDQINQVFKFFNVMLAGFGAIGMIVAVLGMFNTLTISLLERTKEVGLMITLGGRNRDMRKLFVFEAVLLSLVGAIVGILSAVTAGQIINLAMNAFSRQRGVTDSFQLFATPAWLVLGTILFMLCVGLLVVYIPARRAARINPIDALRRE
jgi:ABC-type antimicrobial peptide transport system permease subunit